MKKLIILSDLWGKEKSVWVSHYTERLNQHFDIQYYDCCELGAIDKSIYTEEALHQQFVSGGIERTVHQLTELIREETHILAFSIGGTIAWRFGLQTGNIKSLTAISSTRLRYETVKPKGRVKLYYGKDDDSAPAKSWFDQLGVDHELIKDQGHVVYRESELAAAVAEHLLSIG
ncbi:MAG: alpha/beta hydrolase [Roseivirga sp.]